LEVEDEAEDLVREFESALKRRRRGDVVRLKISSGAPLGLRAMIMEELAVSPDEMVEVRGLLGVADLKELVLSSRPDLLWPPFSPRVPERIEDHDGDMFAAIKQKAKENKHLVIAEILSRRTGKRENEYEGKSETEITQWFVKTELVEMGYEKMVKEFDEKLAMENMLGQRKLTTGEIQKHLDNFGLEPQFAQHSKIGMLSGGQKVKIVLGACMWNLPHVVILDEPTNALDPALKTIRSAMCVLQS
jgi:hypothetical protein